MSKSSSGGGIIASVLIALVASVGLSAGGFGIGYGTGVLFGPADQEQIQQEKTENNQSKQDVQKASCAGPNLTIENGTVTWISETWAQNGGRSIPGYENLVDSPTAPQTPTNQDTTDNLNQEPIATKTQDQAPPQAQNPAQSQGTSQNARNTNKGGNSTASKPSSSQTQTGVKIDPSSPSASKPQGENTQSGGNSNIGVRGNADNFYTYDNADQQNTDDKRVLNTSTKKIHYPSCGEVKKIAPQNYNTSNLSENTLLNQGYTTCKKCH